MLKVLIIEDEEVAARRLAKMIAQEVKEVEFFPTIVSIQTAVNWFRQHPQPDMLFLDVHLADGQSFEIFKQVQITCPIIFTTAYDQYALEAFKVNSIDYLLKPIKKEDLQRALAKFSGLTSPPAIELNLERLLASLQDKSAAFKQRFVVKYGDHLKTIEASEIAYFYTENKANFLVTYENKRYAIDQNLDYLEGVMDPKKFFRINRQFVIGYHSIAEMLTYSKSRVLIKLQPATKLETIVSAERSAAFKSWLDG